MKKLILISVILGLLSSENIAQRRKTQKTTPKSSIDESIFAGLKLRNLGAGNTGGRITDVAIHPQNKNIRYLAVASGGVCKSTNMGTTWTPIFDNEGSYSIGTVVIDEKNPNIIWVGTGENNAQR